MSVVEVKSAIGGLSAARRPASRRHRRKTFASIKIDPAWSFTGATIKDTAYITHGFYTYPAKFIPQLARRLIVEHSREGALVIDPFMGSGTTLVEAMVENRRGLGVDVNEIAVLVSKVKTTPLNQERLQKAGERVMARLDESASPCAAALPERIDYWFAPRAKHKLLILREAILRIRDADIRDFFLVAFAQILKSCSIWMQKSVKPTRDWDKKEIDPWAKFSWQWRKMLHQHGAFLRHLRAKPLAAALAETADCRHLPCEDGEAALVVTSPPYVTSYEYADLHQLPALWLGHLDELASFRQKFIGSQGREGARDRALQSKRADDIVAQLGQGKKAESVRNYFADMLESFEEMKRALRPGGKAAIVIGNTSLQGVDILNAQVFEEQLHGLGFATADIIKREIPSKMLPSVRDEKNGRFVRNGHRRKQLAYPTEYILVMERR